MNLVRITHKDFKKIRKRMKGFKRYRGPFGIVMATRASARFEIQAAGGTVTGDEGDYLCVAEDNYDCWCVPAISFPVSYELLPELDDFLDST